MDEFELQCLKLASQLHKKGAIYLLDEPTDGLHLKDIDQLLELLNRLVDQGNSLIFLEHHMSVIKRSEWIIEVAPEGGEQVGKLLFAGTPQELVDSEDVITRPYM